MKKALLTAIFGLALAMGGNAQVVVRIGPPRPLIERRLPPPSPRHVWTPGYYRYERNAYVWAPGAWVVPPRPRAHWVPAHWRHGRGGYYFVEGHWR